MTINWVQGTLARASSDYEATRSLGARARKAQELLRRQKEIDKDVARQWGDARAAGASWAGQVSHFCNMMFSLK